MNKTFKKLQLFLLILALLVTTFQLSSKNVKANVPTTKPSYPLWIKTYVETETWTKKQVKTKTNAARNLKNDYDKYNSSKFANLFMTVALGNGAGKAVAKSAAKAGLAKATLNSAFSWISSGWTCLCISYWYNGNQITKLYNKYNSILTTMKKNNYKKVVYKVTYKWQDPSQIYVSTGWKIEKCEFVKYLK